MKRCEDCDQYTKFGNDKYGIPLAHGCRIVTELHPIVGWYHVNCFEHNADGECDHFQEKVDYEWKYIQKRNAKIQALKEKLADAPWWKKPGVWWRG